MPPSRRHKCLLHIACSTLLISLAACNHKDKPASSQIAAKVNDTEISVHQINYVLSHSKVNLTAEQIPLARREVLDKLVDQQLAIEQALERKLDRTPEVLMALESGRREILARAYIEQVVAAQAKPTPTEAKKYIADNRALFADRRIFTIQEIILPADSKLLASLREMLNGGKSMDDIGLWLKAKDIKFYGGSATRAAEQIPLDLLLKVQTLKDGQGLVLESPDNITVMRLLASQPAPLAEATALPRVQQYLGNQRASTAILNDFKQLKSKAIISFQGEFIPADEKTAAVPAKPAAEPPPAVDTKVDRKLEKGMAGIR